MRQSTHSQLNWYVAAVVRSQSTTLTSDVDRVTIATVIIYCPINVPDVTILHVVGNSMLQIMMITMMMMIP